jgi:hypothetical protein
LELQFEPKVEKYLRQSLFQTQNLEETQELKLPPELPDVGSVVASWGQCILRSKQWQGTMVTTGGGVMVWILYKSAEDDTLQIVDAWVPFQSRWNLPDSQQEGIVRVNCLLRGVEARMVSARRMMLRVGVGITAEALERAEMVTYTPSGLPEDVQLLKNTYPLQLPKEAGERSFMLEEELPLPVPGEESFKILHCSVVPVVQEQKTTGSRMAFRGCVMARILYDTNGAIQSWDAEMPFSQISELDHEYEQDCRISIIPAITSVETDLADGKLLLRCGLTGQYVIYGRIMAEVIEDAYSPKRTVELTKEDLNAPIYLDNIQREIHMEGAMGTDGTVLNMVFYPDAPQTMQDENSIAYHFGGTFQSLEQDGAEEMASGTGKGESVWEFPQGMDTANQIWMYPSGIPSHGISSEGNTGKCRMTVELTSGLQHALEIVKGITLGEEKRREGNRPSLILCRPKEEETLWQLAKRCGSTVEVITKANQMDPDNLHDDILLIPLM